MKIQITYRLFYNNRNITKIVNISKCLDFTHAENKFKKWSNKKFKAAKDIKILDSMELEKDETLEYLKTMFNLI